MLYIINGNMVSVINEYGNKTDYKLDNQVLEKINNDNDAKVFYITLNIKSLDKKNNNENLYNFLTGNYDNEELENIGIVNKREENSKIIFAHVIDNKNLFSLFLKKRKKIQFLSFTDIISTLTNINKDLKKKNFYNFSHNLYLIHTIKFEKIYICFNIYFDKEEEEIKISNFEILETIEETSEYILTSYNNTISLEEYLPFLITNFDIDKIKLSEDENVNNLFDKTNLLENITADTDKNTKNIISNYSKLIFQANGEINQNNIRITKTIYIDPVKFINKEVRSSTIKLVILGGIGVVFFGAGYYIQNNMIAEIEEAQQSKLDDLNAKLSSLKNRKAAIEAKLVPYNILKKEYKKEKNILLLPYIETYFEHFNLKIKKLYMIKDPRNGQYKLFVFVNGFIPNQLLDKLKNIGLTAFDILPKSNVINSGFNYVFSFDIKKFNEVIKKSGLVY